MKNIIGFTTLFVLTLSLLILFSNKNPKVLSVSKVVPIASSSKLSFVDEYNTKINLIKTFSSNIQTEQAGIGYSAKLAYDKNDLKFRFLADSRFGREMDIGTNSNLFWFWSKRFSSALYYDSKDKIKDCNLKPQFNPNFLIKILGLEPIKNNIVTDQGMLSYEEIDRMVYICIIKNNLPARHYLYNNNKVIAYAEVIEYQQVENFIVPKKMKLIIPDENVSIDWTFADTEINKDMKDQDWSLPKNKQKVEITRS